MSAPEQKPSRLGNTELQILAKKLPGYKSIVRLSLMLLRAKQEDAISTHRKDHVAQFKHTVTFERLNPSAQILIETLARAFERADINASDAFLFNHTLEQTPERTVEASDLAAGETLVEFLKSHSKLALPLYDHLTALEKNKAKAERWMRWGVTPMMAASTLFNLGGKGLPAPLDAICKPFMVGFDFFGYLIRLKAAQYDPDLAGPYKMNTLGNIIGAVTTLSTAIGIAALLLGGAAVGVALAPISLFIGTAGISLNNLIQGGANLLMLGRQWPKQENEKSPWPRRIATLSDSTSYIASAAFAAVLATTAFIAISNPIGLSVAAGLLLIWGVATAAIAVTSFIITQLAQRAARKQMKMKLPKSASKQLLLEEIELHQKAENKLISQLKTDKALLEKEAEKKREPEKQIPEKQAPEKQVLEKQVLEKQEKQKPPEERVEQKPQKPAFTPEKDLHKHDAPRLTPPPSERPHVIETRYTKPWLKPRPEGGSTGKPPKEQ